MLQIHYTIDALAVPIVIYRDWVWAGYNALETAELRTDLGLPWPACSDCSM